MQVLRTKRLVLRNFKEQDAYSLYRYRCLDEVKKYQAWDRFEYQDAIDLISKTCAQVFSGLPGIYQWGIYLDERLIGDLFWQITEEGICWIGYTLDPDFWHHGYGYEAVSALLSYLKNYFGLKVFMARILAENQPSIRLIDKLGFERLYPEIYIQNNWYK